MLNLEKKNIAGFYWIQTMEDDDYRETKQRLVNKRERFSILKGRFYFLSWRSPFWSSCFSFAQRTYMEINQSKVDDVKRSLKIHYYLPSSDFLSTKSFIGSFTYCFFNVSFYYTFLFFYPFSLHYICNVVAISIHQCVMP